MAYIAHGIENNSSKRNFFTTELLFTKNSSHETPDNDEEFFSLITNFIEPGNVIPNFWYKMITDQKQNPDLNSITILSEIIALYRLILKDRFPVGTFINADRQPILVGTSLRISYEYFFDKFSLSKAKVRRALIKLEKLNIVERSVTNIALIDGTRCNRLKITVKEKFLQSCFRNPNTDIRTQNKEFSFKSAKLSKKNLDNTELQSIQICHDLISNKNIIINNRSKGSNILKNNFEEESTLKTDIDNKHIQNREQAIEKSQKPNLRDYFPKAKKLCEFYPLSTEDCEKLQSSSGREFSLNAMNEILKDMSRRISDRYFYSKKGFLGYMTKVFQNEMRDAVKVSNLGFRIKANIVEVSDNNEVKPVISYKDPKRVGAWGKISELIIRYLGSKGENTYKNWFSKLEPEIDEEEKTVRIRGKALYVDWITNNYHGALRESIRKAGFTFIGAYS